MPSKLKTLGFVFSTGGKKDKTKTKEGSWALSSVAEYLVGKQKALGSAISSI